MENKDNLNENIELMKDKNTNLSLRTKESLKAEFKSIEGVTDNDKLVKLLELYRKFQSTQSNFSIDANLNVIEKAFDTIKSQVKAISSSVNQHEITLNETYVEGIADEMKLLKEQIQKEDVLNLKIEKLEKELDILNKKCEEKDELFIENQEKIKKLGDFNNKYLALNNELVNKENNYINQLREKDNIISSKDTKINEIKNEYESKLRSLEQEKESSIKEHESKVVELDKENAVLKANIKNAEGKNKELENRVKLINTESKNKIEECKIKIEELEKQLAKAQEDKQMAILEKVRLESKIENSEIKVGTKSNNQLKNKLKPKVLKDKERNIEINKDK